MSKTQEWAIGNVCANKKRIEFVNMWRKLLAVVIVLVVVMGMLAITQLVLRGSIF